MSRSVIPGRNRASTIGVFGESAAYALVPTSRPARVAMWVLLGFLIGFTLLLSAPWQQSASGAGRVVAYVPTEREQRIEAPIEGRVVEWFVREGTHVERDAVVVRISDNDPDILLRLREERQSVLARVEAIEARVSALDARVDFLSSSREAVVASTSARQRMSEERLRAADQALIAARGSLQTSLLNQERQEALHGSGLASTRTRELADLELTRMRTEVERAEASLRAAREEVEAHRRDVERAGFDTNAAINDARASRQSALADIASARGELARIDVRLARQTTMEVRAPSNGTVLRLFGGVGGEMVRAGEPLVVFVPDTAERAVEMWLSGMDVPLVEVGRKVRIQFEGWPAVQFVGWPSAAVGTFGGVVSLIDVTDDGQGNFRVLIVPDHDDDPWPSLRYLRQGVRANGWVLLNRVSVAYELWRRFNGFPPIVSKTEPGKAKAEAAK